jgi:hypothetical protein
MNFRFVVTAAAFLAATTSFAAALPTQDRGISQPIKDCIRLSTKEKAVVYDYLKYSYLAVLEDSNKHAEYGFQYLEESQAATPSLHLRADASVKNNKNVFLFQTTSLLPDKTKQMLFWLDRDCECKVKPEDSQLLDTDLAYIYIKSE